MVRTSKRLFVPIILLLIGTIVLCLFLCSIINIQGLNTQQTGLVSTDDQAIQIALPLAKTYAKENNYTITLTRASLGESTRPYWLVEIEFKTTENKDKQNSSISIFDLNQQSNIFNAIESEGYQSPSYLYEVNYVYEVTIWADTGEIYHHGIMILNTRPNDSSDMAEIRIPVDQAFEIALPFAQAYAQENNRTITTNVSVYAGYVNSRPSLQIDIYFEPIAYDQHSVQYYIHSYAVTIWGDTGEIRHHGEQGYY
ncbi:MAG: hypothetical protein LBE76_09580 [Nitrososphaerota archaeon]|nr:hypothetical protein [Nitrososphaerota archaeon]